MVFPIEKACILVAAVLSFKHGVCHPYGLVSRGACVYLVYLYSFFLHFLPIHLKSTLLHLFY
jgi:hypothetical protein